jgi:four helix bundle protein
MIPKKSQNFRDLDIWQEAMEVARRIYEVTTTFPEEERQGLTAQIRRSAVRIPSDIAEGSERRIRREFRSLLTQSLGHLAELETQLSLASDLGFLPKDAHDEAVDRLHNLSGQIRDFMKGLVRRPAS